MTIYKANEQTTTCHDSLRQAAASPLGPARLVKGRILYTRALAVVLLPLLMVTPAAWTDNTWIKEGFEWAGFAAIFLCVLGRIWCAAYIAGRKKKLIVDVGPYSISRNPLYLFSFIGVVGIGLLNGSVTWLVVLAVIFILYYRVIVRREEFFLLERFGDDYRRYYERTPRWFPHPGLWRDTAEITLSPRLLMCAIRDATCLLLALPAFEGMELIHSSNLVPTLVSLP